MVARGEMTLEQVLDKVLSVTPADKTVMQYNHNRKLMTATPEGVREYVGDCRAKDIKSFCVLSPLFVFSQSPWKELYTGLR